jgi:hypothetical protein
MKPSTSIFLFCSTVLLASCSLHVDGSVVQQKELPEMKSESVMEHLISENARPNKPELNIEAQRMTESESQPTVPPLFPYIPPEHPHTLHPSASPTESPTEKSVKGAPLGAQTSDASAKQGLQGLILTSILVGIASSLM